MKKTVFLSILLLLAGCSAVQESAKKVKNFSKCYINKMPAPFWVCYQSLFMSVGKVYTPKPSRLKQEEAYSIAVNNLLQKLQNKTKIFMQKAGIQDKKLLDEVKNYVIINAMEGKSWFDDKNHILYVEAAIDEDEFKNFLKEKVKIKDFENIFNETF